MSAIFKVFVTGGLMAASAVALASSAGAGSVFSTFGPGMSYDPGTAWAVDGASFSPSFTPAFVFSPSQSGFISSVQFAGYYVLGTNDVTVSLWTDNAGAFGTELESWDVTTLTPNPGGIITLAASGVDLTAGQNYFLQISAGSADTLVGWSFNSIGVTGEQYENGLPFAADKTLAAFQVNAPEPAAWALILAGFAGLGAALRTRRERGLALSRG